MPNKQLWLELMKKFGPILIAIILMFFVTRLHADYEDGVNAAFKGDYQTAFREFSSAAEAGLDLAQYNLAILYFTGQGVAQDLPLAFKWTQAAALQGHLGAQANLGSLYFDGTGTPRDIDKGLAWFSSAARSGHGASAFALASMYFEGEPLDRNLALAHAWASLALLHDHPDAESLRGQIEQGIAADELSQARRTFARWQIEAAARPNS